MINKFSYHNYFSSIFLPYHLSPFISSFIVPPPPYSYPLNSLSWTPSLPSSCCHRVSGLPKRGVTELPHQTDGWRGPGCQVKYSPPPLWGSAAPWVCFVFSDDSMRPKISSRRVMSLPRPPSDTCFCSFMAASKGKKTHYSFERADR